MSEIKINCVYKQMVPIGNLNPHPKNPNKHTKEQIKRLAKIIEYQGFRKAITVSVLSGHITAGHGRLEAAKLLGMDRVPVDFQDYDDENQEFSDLTADNAIAEWAALDLSQINKDILELGPNFDIDLLGIKDFVLEPIEKIPLCNEDDAPGIPQESKVKSGDIFVLGNHRLMCGDSTSIDAVEKLMAGQRADICFTSPPYNGDTHLDYGDGKNKKLYENNFDSKTSEDYISFCHEILKNIFIITRGFIFWNVSYNAKSRFEYIKAITPFVDNLWETIVWKKTGMPIQSGLTRNCEFIFCFKGYEPKTKHLGDLNETNLNLWEISNINSQIKESHRACFPVELPIRGIELSSNINDIVFEPFGGSGSTLIACEKTNRKCLMMELDPKYCAVILDRWQKYTGKKAHHENGILWDEIKSST